MQNNLEPPQEESENITDVYEPASGSDGTMGLMAGTGMGAIAGGIIGGALGGPAGALLGVAAGGALGAAGGDAATHIATEIDEEYYAGADDLMASEPIDNEESRAEIEGVGIIGSPSTLMTSESTLPPSHVAGDDEIAREARKEP